jgi:hypothetical protein
MDNLNYSEFYPFNLNQIIRNYCFDSDQEKPTTKSNLVELNSNGVYQWYFQLVPIIFLNNFSYLPYIMGPYFANNLQIDQLHVNQCVFVPNAMWSHVYKIKDESKMTSSIALHFESICGRVISNLMFMYLRTVFHQLKNSISDEKGKESIWELVEFLILNSK